jgi:DNA-binding NarL/FixJ family response regulator
VIRVLIADDQALVRAGFRVLLESEPDIRVVGEAANGEEALALAQHERPDVVLMDIRMPVLDGIEATRQIVGEASLAAVRILILTTFETDEDVFAALRAGASGFLLKDTEPADLLRGIRLVAEGEALLAPSVARRLIAELATRPLSPRTHVEQLESLTRREREVMVLVASGLSNDQIAERLTISPATAKTHVSRAMSKLGAHDRAQLVVLAYESGLVVAGEHDGL